MSELESAPLTGNNPRELMTTPAGQVSDANPPPVSLRQEQSGDDGFLFDVYASTRAEELALTNWSASMRRNFLAQQFTAMCQGYRSMFPTGEFSIIEFESKPVGRIVINRSQTEIRVVDFALLPEHQNRGIGTFLMQQICAEAVKTGQPTRLCVLKGNRARRWYERLGFKKIGEQGFYDELEWRPEISGDLASLASPTG